MMPKSLTEDQIEQFHRDGFLVYGPILTAEELAALRAEIDRIAAGEGPPGVVRNPEIAAEQGGLRDAEERSRYWQLLAQVKNDPVIARHAGNPRILDIIEDLLGTEDIKCFADQTMLKPGGHGSQISWHQDSAYWTRVTPPALISCWVALDDATLDNGCMYMLPGTHKQGVVPFDREQRPGIKGQLHVRNLDTTGAQPVIVPAGGCSFHHSCTIHGSGPNRTTHPRRAVIVAYMRADSYHAEGVDPKPEYLLMRGREHPGCV